MNDPQNNGIGMCLYDVHVCEIAYMLRLAGSTLIFGMSLASCCVFVQTPFRHAERHTSIYDAIEFELKELEAQSSIVQYYDVLNLHRLCRAGWKKNI